MVRSVALALLLSTSAFASDLDLVDELPEAATVEETTGAIDLSDEDDFAFEAEAANPVPATPAAPTAKVDLTDSDDLSVDTEPTRASFSAPAPKLPSVDHVEFEDDFEFEAGAARPAAKAKSTSHVELVDLDGEIEDVTSEAEVEEVRPELPELAGIEDEGLPEKAVDTKPVGDVQELLSDDDDIELNW